MLYTHLFDTEFNMRQKLIFSSVQVTNNFFQNWLLSLFVYDFYL